MSPSAIQEQDNTWSDTWSEFWSERRIGDLVRRSGDKELIQLEVQLREKVYPLLFNEEAMKSVKPSIIHGDLWSGNSGTDEQSGRPIIFDPSSSYSHNEAELGIMKMFGGYNTEFFDAYHQVIPKAQPHYDQRIDMYEAYHHLNHFVIFGGGYRAGTVRIFKKLIDWAEQESNKKRRSAASSTNGGGSEGDKQGQDAPSTNTKGLRGGARGKGATGNALAGPSCQESSKKRSKRSDSPSAPPPPAASAGHAAMSFSSNPTVFHSMTEASTTTTTIAPTPAQIADFFSQMVCYIWFANSVTVGSGNKRDHSNPCTPARSPVLNYQPQHRSPLTPRRRQAHSQRVHHVKIPSNGSVGSNGRAVRDISPVNALELSRAMQNDLIASSISSNSAADLKAYSSSSEPSMQRLQPRGRFLRFTRELLNTTQLSTSVITLALVYVHRLKALHPHLQGRHGSEYRVGIAALMLANKILDDNTYLNKTWAEISGMPLIEISRMEVEFWLGLKMELHVSQESYESGLRDLHVLSLERTRMIQEREAILKRMSQPYVRTDDHSTFMGAAAAAASAASGLQGQRLRNSVPYAHGHWNASSDALVHHPFSFDPASSRHAALRHSAGYAEHFPTAPFAHQHVYPAHAAVHSPSVAFPSAAYISPTQGVSYTLPSSPLSQGSGVPSLATTMSNEALAYPSDVEARTPQDYVGLGHENTTAIYGNVNGGRSQHFGSQTPERFPAVGGWPMQQQPNNGMSWPTNVRQEAAQTGHVRSSSFNTPVSTVTGLKRDFERANIGSGPSSEVQAFKRMAFDSYSGSSTLDGAERQRHARLPSTGQYSPLDTQSAWAATAYRTSNSSSPYAAYTNDLMRVSASPSHVNGAGMQLARPHSAQRLDDSTSTTTTTAAYAPSTLGTTYAGNANVVAHRVAATAHPGYHSVFSSALTPTALAAPLEISQTSWPMERAKAPLHYYSLAAGEPHGNVGTFFASSSSIAQEHDVHAQQPTTTTTTTTTFGLPFGDGEQTFAAHHDIQALRPAAPTKLPTYAGSSFDRDYDHGNASFGLRSSEFAPNVKQMPAFQLDPHGWPLPVSSTPAYLFPYHLMPPQPQP